MVDTEHTGETQSWRRIYQTSITAAPGDCHVSATPVLKDGLDRLVPIEYRKLLSFVSSKLASHELLSFISNYGGHNWSGHCRGHSGHSHDTRTMEITPFRSSHEIDNIRSLCIYRDARQKDM